VYPPVPDDAAVSMFMGEVGVVLDMTDMGDASVVLAVCEMFMGITDLEVGWASL
jgi:hypothetical protein